MRNSLYIFMPLHFNEELSGTVYMPQPDEFESKENWKNQAMSVIGKSTIWLKAGTRGLV